MSSAAVSSSSSSFTQAVVNAMRRLYPEHLADKSFDNTGLLWEAPVQPNREPQRNSVLLTIDLTTAVADEAIRRRDSVIVTYHPIIFRGLKSLTLADSQQRSLLRLAAEGISVYSPHTAVDAAEGGNADWLGDIVTGEVLEDAGPAPTKGCSTDSGYRIDSFPSSYNAQPDKVKLAAHAHTRAPLQPTSSKSATGIGRLLTLEQPRPLSSILNSLTTYLGQPPAFQLALPQTFGTKKADYNPSSSENHFNSLCSVSIRTISICAGSGGGVLSSGEGIDADLWVTGELVHHEALAAIERGTSVVALAHSNSERAYLGAVLKGRLEEELSTEGDVEVKVSEKDRDPFLWAVKG